MAETYINLGGQAHKFNDVDELRVAIDEYFQDCDDRNAPYTVSGLALALETSRRLLLDIQKSDHYSNDFKHLINLAKARILSRTEEGMLSNRYNAAGSIFTLKNNFGYVDKTESVVEHKSIGDDLEKRRMRVINAAKPKELE